MNKLAIIGAGQLGSRHLQALGNIVNDNLIYVVDPSELSLSIAAKRFDEISAENNTQNVKYISSIGKLPEELDVVIVSTSSFMRKDIISELLDSKSVKYLILEKVLFQSISDYSIIGNKLRETNIKAWVNCPRRMNKSYEKIKSELKDQKLLEFNVAGNNWGIASNIIHYIDLLAYLTDTHNYKITENRLLDEMVDSKREGYIEFSGSVGGLFNNGVHFNISSYKDTSLPLTVSLIGNSTIYIIRELEKKALFAAGINNWKWEEKEFEFPYQSQLTDKAVLSLLESGQCSLTPYEKSAELHLPVLSLFLNHYRNIMKDESIDKCPIT